MRQFICDRCGLAVTHTDGIVGSEFEYQGFSTVRCAGVVDLCEGCFAEAQRVRSEAMSKTEEAATDAVKAFLVNGKSAPAKQ